MSWLDRDPLGARPELAEMVGALREQSAATVPGRLHELMARRVAQLVGSPGLELPDDLDERERAVVTVAEQLLVDVHGLTDDDVATLARWFTLAEQVAILFDLALIDGFALFDRVFDVSGSVG